MKIVNKLYVFEVEEKLKAGIEVYVMDMTAPENGIKTLNDCTVSEYILLKDNKNVVFWSVEEEENE